MLILKSSVDKTKINGAIVVEQLRLIDKEGKNKGCVTLKEALSAAEDAGLDLVQLTNDPVPVCRIMDYGKYKYAALKKSQSARHTRKLGEVKEIKMNLSIGDNDYQVKLRAARAFIGDGKKVKISMRFRGREVVHADLGRKVFERLIRDIEDLSKLESPPKMEGNTLRMVLTKR